MEVYFLPFPFFCMSSLLISVLVVFSSSSLFSAWVGLEMGLLSFIPLIYLGKMNYSFSEASMKYFLIQAFSSIVLLLGVLFFWKMSFYLILFSLFLKLGAAPLHFWVLAMVESLAWPSLFVLLTVQKISPLLILFMFIESCSIFVNFFILCSAIVGGLGGMSQTLLRSLITYSSIGHVAWMMASLYFNFALMFQYFLIYAALILPIVFLFNNYNFYHLTQISFMRHYLLKTLLFFLFLSLGGLPPFLGFLPKWLVISYLSDGGWMFLVMILIFTSLLTLYYYLRMTFSAFMFSGASFFFLKTDPRAVFLWGVSFSLLGMMVLPLFVF